MIDLISLCFEYFLGPEATIYRWVLWGYIFTFFSILFAAIFGRNFGIRKKYLAGLDKLFAFAQSRTPTENDEVDFLLHFDDELVISPERPRVKRNSSCEDTFAFEDLLPYITAGMRSVVDDCVNKTFAPEKLPQWNMLSRNRRKIPKTAKSVTFLWVTGFIFRYVFLLPVRLFIFAWSLLTMIVCTFFVGLLPDNEYKKKANAFVTCWSFVFVASCLSVDARFHDRQYKPKYGIAVANHTSPIDSMILSIDQCYDMVGQKATGVLGWFMKALSKSSTHIWFERTKASDRSKTFQILKEHAKDPALPPILIYPEGTCVNNTTVLLFRKGVFELDTPIHPIAMKFHPKYGDAFWWQDGFFTYILGMMSSWAIVCDIWYLPSMVRQLDEPAIEFANRVKSAIATKGGLTELGWDGVIKYVVDLPEKVTKEASWKRRQQTEFAKTFKLNRLENDTDPCRGYD